MTVVPGGKVLVLDDHGKGQLYERDVVEALAAIGLMVREADGEWHVHTPLPDMETMPELAICDFCNQRPVTWYVDCAPFTVGGDDILPMNSLADWLACEACGDLIAADDRVGLILRSLDYTRSRVPPGYPVAPFLRAQGDMLLKFWQHYTGIRRLAAPYREAP